MDIVANVEDNTMDIMMTATIRPELVEKTLRSFRNNLFGSYKDCRLLINIDPVRGIESTATRRDVLAIVDSYFSEKKTRLPKKPHFPHAIHWLWAQAESEFVFHLEDDWECVEEIDINHMVRIMESQPNLLGLRLNAYRTWEDRCRPSSAKGRSDWLWNGQYYERPRKPGRHSWYSNHPTLFRSGWVKAALPFLGDKGSTERYISGLRKAKEKGARDLIYEWRYGIYAVPSRRCILDIGRGWRKQNGVRKNARWSFTHWKPVEE
jgi:hypothetical protein